MNEQKPGLLDYELYSESEWRILFFDELLNSRPPMIIDPRDKANEREYKYYKSLPSKQQEKLKYLIPLDGWFAMIIYPSGEVKNTSQWDLRFKVMDQIEAIKRKEDDHGNKVEGLKNPMRGRWPIEVELDSCRHF